MKKHNGYALTIYMLMTVLGASTYVTIHCVGSLRDTGSLRCGSKVTFVCSIPAYKYTMKWLIDSDKVAECVTTNCVQYPPYKVDNIKFSSDISKGEFNMTINPVSLKADGRKIKCSYGSESDQLQLAVKVQSRRNTTEIVETKDENRNMINITAMTGCVFPSAAITLQWSFYEEDHASKLYNNKMTSANVDSELSVCSFGTCGGNDKVKISSTLSIPEVQHGKEYVFQIAIRHKDTGDIVLVNSTRSYKINDALTTVKIDSVGSLRDTGSVRCGSKVTFICSIPTYTFNMVWLIDFHKVAECTTTNCVQYPPYKVDNIEFSSDTSNGEFNMTINPVTLKADGRKIKCIYGSESVQLKLAVKVLPNMNTAKIVERKDANGNMINLTVVTECVFPSSAISMQWYYYEEGHTPKLYNRSSPIKASYFSVCSSGTCEGNDVVKLSSTLALPDEQNGKEYFFQIAITYKDTGDIILVNSTRYYRINEITSEIDKETYLSVYVIAIGTLALFLLVLTSYFASKLMGQLHNRRRNRQPTLRTTNLKVNGTEDTENKISRTRTASGAGSNVIKPLDDPDKTEEEGNNDDSCSNDSTSINKTKHIRNIQPTSRTTNLIVQGIEDIDNKHETDLTETRKDSDAVNKVFDDPDKTEEEGNNDDSCSIDWISIKETKHIRNRQPTLSTINLIAQGIEYKGNKNETDLTETRTDSVTKLFDDQDKSEEEGDSCRLL